MAFSGLNISIGGNSSGARGAIGSVKSALGALERSANSAQDSIEELGDESTQTSSRLSVFGASVGASVLSLLGLSSAAKGATASLGALAASTGTVTVALVGFAAVAAPLVATVGALVAAGASLAAVFGGGVAAGAATHMTQLKEAFAEARAEIMELIEPVGELFGPVLVDAVEALPALVEGVLDAVGPLEEFRDALVEFGDMAMGAIPAVAAAVGDLARRALPVLMDLVGVVGGAAPGAFDAMFRVATRVSDELIALGEAVVSLIPPLTKTGVILIEALAPAVTAVIDVVGDILEKFTEVASSDGAREQFTALAEAARDDLANGVEAARDAIVPLLPLLADLVRDFAPVIQEVGDEAPGALRAFGAAAKDLLEMATRVSDVVAPVLTALVDISGDLFDAFNDLSPAAQKVTVALLALGPVLSGLSTAVTAVIGVGGTLIGILGSVAGVAGTVFSVLGTLVAILGGPLTVAIGVAIAAIAAYKMNLFGFRDAVNNVLSAVRQAFEMFASKVTAAWGYLTGTGEGSLIGDVKSALNSLRNFVASVWNLDPLSDTFEAVVATIMGGGDSGGIIPTLKSDIKSAFNALRSFFASVWDLHPLSDAFEEAVEAIGRAFERFNFGPFENALNSVAGGVRSLIDALNTLSGVNIDVDVPSFSDLLDEAKSIVDDDDDNDIGGGDGGFDDGGDTGGTGGGGGTLPPIGGGGGGSGGGGGVGQQPGSRDPDSNEGRDDGDGFVGLSTGGLVDSPGAAILHDNERVLPESQVSDRGEASFDPNSVADGFDESTAATQIVSELRQLRQAVESDATVTDRDVVRGLERMFDRHGGSV